MLGLILFPALAIGCFSLAFKGFPKQGMPLTESSRLTGTPAIAVGVICLVLGVAFVGATCMIVYVRAFPKR